MEQTNASSQQVFNNERRLDNCKRIYQNLLEFSYSPEDDALIFRGKIAKLNGYSLSLVDSIFFEMDPEDIFNYFFYEFYYNSYESNTIKDLFNQLVITEEEVDFIEKFVQKFVARCGLYLKNRDLFERLYNINDSIRKFTDELLMSIKVFEYASLNRTISGNSPTDMLSNFYQKHKNDISMIFVDIKNTNNLSNVNQPNNVQNAEKGMSLTRSKNSVFPTFDEESYLRELEIQNKFSVAGFTSIILIIISAISIGIYLAITLLT